MQKGDIVLVRFPFTDLSSEKLRPALVLTEETKTGDVILAFITSQITQKEDIDILISESSDDFRQTGLKKESLIKLNKITTLNRRIIVGKIGKLSDADIIKVDAILKELFKIKG